VGNINHPWSLRKIERAFEIEFANNIMFGRAKLPLLRQRLLHAA